MSGSSESSPDAALRRCWRRLASGTHDATLQQIVARYAEPHRRYHTATHITWVLRHVDDLLAVEPDVDDADAVRAAALFHDIVYDPLSSTNERDSAVMAVTSLAELGWSSDRLAVVHDLIVCTAHHHATTPAERVLDDADLAVLGAEPAAYQAYVNGVRAEYAHVSEPAWHSGRSAVLQSFLDRDRIFATETMRQQRERRARANIAAELAALAARR